MTTSREMRPMQSCRFETAERCPQLAEVGEVMWWWEGQGRGTGSQHRPLLRISLGLFRSPGAPFQGLPALLRISEGTPVLRRFGTFPTGEQTPLLPLSSLVFRV